MARKMTVTDYLVALTQLHAWFVTVMAYVQAIERNRQGLARVLVDLNRLSRQLTALGATPEEIDEAAIPLLREGERFASTLRGLEAQWASVIDEEIPSSRRLPSFSVRRPQARSARQHRRSL
jgi:hypothetical protein